MRKRSQRVCRGTDGDPAGAAGTGDRVAGGLIDNIVGNATTISSVTGGVAWHRKIKPDVLASLEQLRARFKEGKLPFSAHALATAIKNELALDVTPKTVREWLLEKT